MVENPKISVIIVNYNVQDFLEQALLSIERALKDISSEIFVVDNASIDGSVQMLHSRFPGVRLIESKSNLGFSGGNNLALKKARGEFVVLINPDTVVQEDTFSKLLEFFAKKPEASAATCKILNPDGSFSVDCRHSVPTPMTALWKLLGLNKLFPKSKIFGRYNLTYLDENEQNQVEAISGSFMMIRKEVVDKIGLLDEMFFMYCEDIDYCHRINLSGGQIYYVPESQIIHYKGESTKNNNLDYVVTFNKSLYLFYKKHYQKKYIYPVKWLIFLGVIIRGMMIFIKNNVRLYFPVILDLFLLNLVMLISFYIRFESRSGFRWVDFFNQYIVIHVMTTVAYFLSALFFDVLSAYRYSISRIIKANISAYTFVAALTFFFKQFGFSRLVVVISAIGATLVMVSWRLILKMYSRKASSSLLSSEYFQKRTLIVGFDKEAKELIGKLTDRIDSGVSITGIVSPNEADIGKLYKGLPVVTSINQLQEYLNIRRIELVIFSTHNIPYESILKTMSGIRNPRMEFKMAPGHLEFMIGKSSVERLDSVPLIDIEYAYGRPFNQILKRGIDFVTSLIILLILLPLNILVVWKWFGAVKNKIIYSGPMIRQNILWTDQTGLIKWSVNLLNVFFGKVSFVGALTSEDAGLAPHFECKPGLTGLVQLNMDRIQNDEQRRNYELHYLKNQNLFMDLEIILRVLTKI